jgi:ribosomal protein S18 acetylase RimI-like enzyme
MTARDNKVAKDDDAAAVLQAASEYFASHPRETNVVATVLTDLVPHPGIGQFWSVSRGDGVAAVAVQVPKGNRAELTPGPGWAIDALVDAMAEDVADLPGVIGEVGAASRFAGRWAECRRLPVDPVEGGRLYVLGDLVLPPPVPGGLRQANDGDRGLVAGWAAAFAAGTGDPTDTVANARHRLARGRLWVWEDGEPVSMASAPAPVNGVARVGLVYTPDDRRGRGYAAACVAALSQRLLSDDADSCILYTQLSNPTSNSIYQRLGYRAVAEILVYRFGAEGG